MYEKLVPRMVVRLRLGAARREEIDLLTPSRHNDFTDAFIPDAYNNLSKKSVKGRFT